MHQGLASRLPTHDGPGPHPLPFAGLGLDLAKTRRKVTGLRLRAFPRREERRAVPLPAMPPRLSGYDLQLRLCREPLGS